MAAVITAELMLRFRRALEYLGEHPAFNRSGQENILDRFCIFIYWVNLENKKKSRRRFKDAVLQIWVECERYMTKAEIDEMVADGYKGKVPEFYELTDPEAAERKYRELNPRMTYPSMEDSELECHAGTFEDAIIMLAEKVKKKFGNDPMEHFRR